MSKTCMFFPSFRALFCENKERCMPTGLTKLIDVLVVFKRRLRLPRVKSPLYHSLNFHSPIFRKRSSNIALKLSHILEMFIYSQGSILMSLSYSSDKAQCNLHHCRHHCQEHSHPPQSTETRYPYKGSRVPRELRCPRSEARMIVQTTSLKRRRPEPPKRSNLALPSLLPFIRTMLKRDNRAQPNRDLQFLFLDQQSLFRTLVR